MDFQPDDDQRALVALAHDILRERATHERLQALEARPGPVFDADLWRAMARAGIAGICVPEEYGGAGRGLLEVALVAEEVGRSVAPVPLVPALALGALPLARYGTPARRAALLPGVAAGTVVLTAAVTGPGATTAEPDGDGWRISGTRSLVWYGGQADAILTPAVAPDGTTALYTVDAEVAGLGVTELSTTSRQPYADLTFDGVRVGADDVLAGGREAVTWTVAAGTAVLCCLQAGVCAEALRLTAEYTTKREQFGKPIGSLQAVAQRAADAYIDTAVVRLTALQAAWRLAAGLPAAAETAVAKFWAAEGGLSVLHACQHLHGGVGVDLSYPLHRYYLATKQAEHTFGSATPALLDLGAVLA